jgi:hypothetical protein
MKITSVQTTIVRVPFTHGDDTSSGRAGNLNLSTMNTLLIQVHRVVGYRGQSGQPTRVRPAWRCGTSPPPV